MCSTGFCAWSETHCYVKHPRSLGLVVGIEPFVRPLSLSGLGNREVISFNRGNSRSR